MRIVESYRRKREVGEDDYLNACELSQYMGWSRWTVNWHKQLGYIFELGKRTTPKHYREWLKINVKRLTMTPSKVEELAVERRLATLH